MGADKKPLLSDQDNIFDGIAAPSNTIRRRLSAFTGKSVKVNSTTTKVTTKNVKIELISGNESVSLIEDNVDGATIKNIIERQNNNDDLDTNPIREKQCDLDFSASLKMEGPDTLDIVQKIREAHFHFDTFLRNYNKTGNQLYRNKNATDIDMHTDFTRRLSELVYKSPDLQRKESTAFLADFSTAETLLGDGVEEYIKAIRRVLRTENHEDDSVTVSFRNMSYEGISPKIVEEEGYNTFASVLKRILCGCCAFTFRATRNIMSSKQPVEYEHHPVLKKISGQIKPGRLTLVLSPPGAGKTSFLKCISGKTYGAGNSSTETTGDIKYNQRDVKDLNNLAAWVSYTGQDDEHQPLLTVRETMQFAFRCNKEAYYEDEYAMNLIRKNGGEPAYQRVQALRKIEVDISLALLGLTRCADTYIGDENLKGVSGGERRRVTLGEMLVTGSQIMCCDEISTGLDSAATFDITSYLRAAAHALHKTIVVALLQPAPEVIDLFDDIFLLAEGRIIYHGPKDKIRAYFESLGYRKDPNKDLGDFLVEVPTKNGILMHAPLEDLKELGIEAPPTDPRIVPEWLAKKWEESEMFKKEMDDIDYESRSLSPGLFNFDLMPQRSYFRALWDTMKWCMLLRMRDSVQVIARVILMGTMGVFQGSLYYQLDTNDYLNKIMLLQISLLLLGMLGIPMCQIICKQRAIFYKHVDAKFYTPGQFAIAQWAVYVPFTIFDVFAFGAVMYWMCGLSAHANTFTTFIFICISYGIVMNTVMMAFPFLSTDQNSAVVGALFTTIMSMLSSGALTPENKIPILFRWMIWINPLAWSFRGLAINEFHSPEFDVNKLHLCKFEMAHIPLILPEKCRDYFLELQQIRPQDYWVPLAIVFNIVCTCIFVFIIALGLKYYRFEAEKQGALPDDRILQEGDTNTKKNKKVLRKKALTAYENDQFLDAVSPRAADELQALSMLSPLGISSNPSMVISPLNSFNDYDDDDDHDHDHDHDNDDKIAMVQTLPKTLLIRDLWYTIPIAGEPIDFLKGVNFYALPGRMMALMGSSGAGKTTLMDCIAGRKTVGYSRGDILINGEPKVQYQFVKYTGYVEQFGVHSDCATVRESLEFSAYLRLPSGTSDKVIQKYVDQTLILLELDDIANEIAGTMSMEQNKRLTLGVELVANPSIVFCDEPTSGLDARAAAIVMRVLLKVARSGRTVVATIHQPSTVIFNFFDDLLLLKRGGEVVYFGELGDNSNLLQSYFTAIPGTDKCPEGYNPATWMLEIIGAGTANSDSNKDYAAIYKQSSLCKDQQLSLETKIEEFISCVNSTESDYLSILKSPNGTSYINHEEQALLEKSMKRTYIRGQLTQIKMLLKRNMQSYWRSPQFSLNRLGVITLFTIVFSGFFFHTVLHDVQDLQNRLMSILFFDMLSTIYNVIVLVPFALSRRALYYRERASNMYSVWAFNWAEGLVEIPWLVLQVVITVPIIYFMTNLNTSNPEPFWYFCLMLFLQLYLMTTISLFSASLFSDPMAATLAAIGWTMPLQQFSGMMPQKVDIPSYYMWLYDISFYRFAYEGLMTTQFHGDDSIICLPKGKPVHLSGLLPEIVKDILNISISDQICSTDGQMNILRPNFWKNITGLQMTSEHLMLEKILESFNYENRYTDVVVISSWIIVLRILTFITSYFINHQKR